LKSIPYFGMLVGMKVEASKKTGKFRHFTLKLPEEVCQAIDEAVRKAGGRKVGLSRQRVVERIVTAAALNPTFVLKVD